jgi:hypothetical protein
MTKQSKLFPLLVAAALIGSLFADSGWGPF